MKHVLSIVLAVLLSSAIQQPAAPVLSCQTITNRTTPAELQQRFGDLETPERRLEFQWADAEHSRLSAIWTVDKKSAWRASNGVKVGMAIGDVELLNGRSFQLRAFEHDEAGLVLNWAGGKLEPAATAPCRVVVRLAPSVEEFTTLEWRLVEAIRTTAEVSSDDRRIRPYRAIVVALGLEWR
jgi:hypothetical protein